MPRPLRSLAALVKLSTIVAGKYIIIDNTDIPLQTKSCSKLLWQSLNQGICLQFYAPVVSCPASTIPTGTFTVPVLFKFYL